VVDTTGPWLADVGVKVGPNFSRVRFPGVGGEAAAAAALRGNNSSRVLPRPGGVALRCCWRTRGGGAPVVELLYRRCSSAAHRLGPVVSLPRFCLVEGETAGVCVEGRRVDQISSCGGACFRAHPPSGSRRVWIQDQWSLGYGVSPADGFTAMASACP
jgi:hypothetical protein